MSQTISYLTLDNEGVVSVGMVDEQPWDDSFERLHAVQERLNLALAFVTEGQMRADYPQTTGRRVRLVFEHFEPLSSDAREFFEIAMRSLPEDLELVTERRSAPS